MHPVFIYFKFSWFFTLLGPDDIILCTVDVVGLYPNIPHDKGLSALCKKLDLRQEKDVTTSAPVELAEVVLKNNIVTFKEKL